MPHPDGGVLVGGAVRDALLERPIRDLDWLVPDPEAAARRCAAEASGSAFALDRRRGHWRVVAGSLTADFAPRPADLRSELARRDFTVNAIAADAQGRLLDPLHGREDLRRRRLALAAPDALERDPLRALRAVRLAATLGLRLTPGTREAVRATAARVVDGSLPAPAWERVREEMELVLGETQAGRALQQAHALGVLRWTLPELAACAGVEQGGFHHLDVLEHSLEALQRLVTGFPEADAALRWATLLHDVGKPGTRAIGEDGRVHFYGHARRGQALAEGALRRLRASGERVRRVGALVRYHMLPLPRDERAARRFVHRRRPLLPDLLQLMIADREAARGPLSSEGTRRAYREALSRVLAILDEAPPRPPLLDGDEVMALLALPPGPRVGEALRLVREAEAVGDVRTADEARALLRRYARAQGWGGDGPSAP